MPALDNREAAAARRGGGPPGAVEAPPAGGAGGAPDEFQFTRQDFERVRTLIYARAGISLADGKRHMVYSRLARRLRALNLERFGDYLDLLDDTASPEWEDFTNALTTNLTAFFREPHHFELLSAQLAALPRTHRPRIWSAGSSTGEEPYSLAITCAEVFGRVPPPVDLLASDLDTQVLATGQAGVYSMERVRNLPTAQLKKYFQRGAGSQEGRCRVIAPLRESISFFQLNLLDSRWDVAGPFDAIFCRNVMIYFDKPTQRRLLERFVRLLAPDGRLYAGHSESFFHAADVVEACGRTVYRRPGGGR